MHLLTHPTGGYQFLTGIAPYSAGVISLPGYEVVHITLHSPLPYRAGLERVRAYLADQDRPLSALCGVELRIPFPFSFQGFIDFNQGYQTLLVEWGLVADGINPIARTNVAPVGHPPVEPALYGFSYTVLAESPALPPTFVVAGAGDLRDQAIMSPSAVVRPGESSTQALAEKATVVMQVMQERLFGLGARWEQVTQVNVYTAHHLESWLDEPVLSGIGPGAIHGICWHQSYPPIADLAFEMDLRNYRRQIMWNPK